MINNRRYGGPHPELWEMGVASIRELEAERGIFASSKSEIYGCVFGRDSLITSLLLLRVYRKTGDAYFLTIVRKVLVSLAELQGKEVNIESGEEPGKCIHEFRPDNHAHLTARKENPWYVYPDNTMRNFDTVDATPLFLMAVHAYYEATSDGLFMDLMMPHIQAALAWMEEYGDTNGDGFIDYRVHPERRFGGLTTHSWMDSSESVFFEEYDDRPTYPIAPVEAQAYAYAALRHWADYFSLRDPERSQKLSQRADSLKKRFNEEFVFSRRGRTSLAFAIDGVGRILSSPRSSMGHVLWAVWRKDAAMPDSILEAQHIPAIARRILSPDLYMRRAGIRTLSTRSRFFDPHSYHNGSIWPHDTAIVAQGLETFGFREEAKRMREGLVLVFKYFRTPLELFVYKRGKYQEYVGSDGQMGCRVQAWSAASLLHVLHHGDEPVLSEGDELIQ